MKTFAIFFLLVLTSFSLSSQICDDDEKLAVITLLTDIYANETSWNIADGQGVVIASGENFQNSTTYIDSICIPAAACLTFTVEDSFGDGIFAPGYIKMELDGIELFNISAFKSSSSVTFDCSPGQSCVDAIMISEETVTFKPEGEWYKFIPDENGLYKVSTCDDVVCDTKLWIYDDCNDILIAEGHEGTTFYGDDGDCGLQAEISGVMLGGDEYYIRVRSDANCQGDMLEISYLGPITGCTNPAACNYNPLATIDDGSCDIDGIDCPKPDLLMDVGALRNSMVIRKETNNDECLINEGCMRGYGERDIINFRTVIANVGDADYFIGRPEENPDQFDYDNCHNHYHYGGYAEYVLYDEYGQYIPIGFKNGFCVIDLTCPSQDMYQYSCNYMGISAGCVDIYDEYLACQWIDITDVPDGNYTFVTRVNWDNAPDALGQIEKDTVNNWAQVCINLDRSSGNLTMDIVDDCEPYLDCLGNLYGKAEVDCKGDCNGSALRGDIDGDGSLSDSDRGLYADQALEHVAATNCSDLNADGKITVYDVAMLTDCMLFGDDHVHIDGTAAHDHCTFPAGIYNSTTPAQFEISEVTADYFTIAMRNSASDILAYQFEISGVEIVSMDNLVDQFTAELMIKSNNTNNLLVMSESNSFIAKNASYGEVLRVYYTAPDAPDVCIEVIEVVNAKYEQIDASENIICASLEGLSTSDFSIDDIKVYPNPFKNQTMIQMQVSDQYQIKLYDTSGRIVRTDSFSGDHFTFRKNDLPEGVLFLTVTSDNVAYRSRLIVQ